MKSIAFYIYHNEGTFGAHNDRIQLYLVPKPPRLSNFDFDYYL